MCRCRVQVQAGVTGMGLAVSLSHTPGRPSQVMLTTAPTPLSPKKRMSGRQAVLNTLQLHKRC